MKLTPDQLHRLIDYIAPLVKDWDDWNGLAFSIEKSCERAGCLKWWYDNDHFYWAAANQYAGLSAVLILLSEGG